VSGIIISQERLVTIKKQPDHNKSLLDTIKETLEKEGFKTCWHNPFMEWLHPDWYASRKHKNEVRDTLYICDLPVPKLTPFDVAAASIKQDSDSLHFSLSIYYSKVLEQITEAAAINDIFYQHDAFWAPKIAECLGGIAMKYGLKWDTEHDVYIEDSMWGKLQGNAAGLILSLLKDMRELA
jgi:hypothetical protein